MVLLTGCRRSGKPGKDGAGPTGGRQTTTPSAADAQRKADELVALAAKSNDEELARKGMAIINELNQSKQADLAVPGLVKLLKDDYVPRRPSAARALRFIGPQAGKAIPSLLEALKDPSSHVRQAVIGALGRICWSQTPPQPADTPKVVRELLGSLSDGSGEPKDQNINRLHALQALGSIGPAAAEALPKIIPMLEDRQAAARSNAALALGDIGGAGASKAAPTLQRLAASDPDEEVRKNASVALGKLKKP
jgi:HEAT repeat protein